MKTPFEPSMIQPSPGRIIFIPFIDAFGGAERLILELSRFLFETRAPHIIASFQQTIDLQSYANWPLELYQLRPRRNSLSEGHALKGFLKSAISSATGRPLLFDLKSAFYSSILSADSFVLHLTDPPSLLAADISKYAPSVRERFAELQKPSGTQTIRAVRGELVHRLNRRGMRRAARVIVMTERIRAELQRLYGVDAMVIRPGVFEKRHERSQFRSVAGPLRILSVSRLEASKRIDRILRALAAVDAHKSLGDTDWIFEIIGQGPEAESLKNLASELGLTSRTHFLGHVSDTELANAYSKAHVFLMPALQGYGLPALEALSRGVPAIVHKDSGVSEILLKSPWVEVVDGNNGSLATAIAKLVERLKNNETANWGLPVIPNSVAWARAVCDECGWL